MIDKNGVFKFGLIEDTSIILHTCDIKKENLHLFDPKFKGEIG